MSSDYYIPSELKDSEWVFLYPIAGNYARMKVEEKVVFIDKNLPKIVASVYHAFPMFIPEYGVVVSLDVSSLNYAKEIYNKINPDEIYSCRVHNYRAQENRMVCWKTFEKQHIDEKLKKILHQNIINELKITPSFFSRGEIISPLRWFCNNIRCDNDKKYFNYNVGIVYLKREWLKNKRKADVRSWTSLTPFEVNSKYVILSPDGRVNVKDVKLHFLEDPEEVAVDENGEYFIAFLISYNGGEAPVNIVNRLDLLIQSAYDVLPFLFPHLVQPSEVEEPIYQFSVGKNVLNHFLERFSKFSYPQSKKIIEEMERKFFSENRLMEINEREGSYIVKVANPSLISLLVKWIHDSNDHNTKRLFENLMDVLLQKGLDAFEKALRSNKISLIAEVHIKRLLQKTRDYSALREKYVSIFKSLNK